jgi:hypothetical protein
MPFDEDTHLGQGRSEKLQQSQGKTAEAALIALLVLVIVIGGYFLFRQ